MLSQQSQKSEETNTKQEADEMPCYIYEDQGLLNLEMVKNEIHLDFSSEFSSATDWLK